MPILFPGHLVNINPPQNPSFPFFPMLFIEELVVCCNCRPILGYSVEMYDLPTGNWVTVTQTDDEATRQAIAIWLQQRVDLKLFGTWTLTNVTSCFNQGRSWTTFSVGSCTGFVWGLSTRLETPFLVALSSSRLLLFHVCIYMVP